MTITRGWLLEQRRHCSGDSADLYRELLDLALIGLSVREPSEALIEAVAQRLDVVNGIEWRGAKYNAVEVLKVIAEFDPTDA